MSFLHPEYFYYLIPLLIAFFAFLYLKKQERKSYFSEDVLKKLQDRSQKMTHKRRNMLFFFIFLLMIIAFAQPVIKDGEVEVKSKSADIMIALDISDSMLAQDVYPDRLQFAKQKALTLLKEAPEERIGVIAFAKNSYLVSPMSFDHSAVGFLLKQLSTDSITEKGTDFISLLDVVDSSLKQQNKKYLLVLTDGGDKEDFSKEIEYAKERGIVVFILGVGTQKGAPIKQKNGEFIKYKGEIIVSKLNENISEFATSSGGVYIEAVKSDKDVKRMLLEIDSVSEQKELKRETIKKFIPLFYYPLILALLLLLFATSSWFQKRSAQLFVLFALIAVPKAEAGLLDFMHLNEAKDAYNAGDYQKSQELYSQYANEANSAKSYYNEANSLYKQEKYGEAIESYEKAKFEDKTLEANRLANIGNAYVKQKQEDSLQKAKEIYEKSLALHEDKQTKENLEAVIKELERQKQEEEKQNQEQQQNQDQQQEEDNKDNQQDNQEQNQENKQNQDSQDESQNDASKEDKQDSENKDSQDDANETKDSQDESDKSQDDTKNDMKNQEHASGADKEKENEQKELDKQKLDELNQEEEKSEQEAAQASAGDAQDAMSDDEQRKWLQQLNANQGSYMYMLNNNQRNEEDLDEKPW